MKTSPALPVHAASKEAREEWREAVGMFLLAYREAAKLLRKGIKDGARVQGAGPSRYAFPEFPYELSVGG